MLPPVLRCPAVLCVVLCAVLTSSSVLHFLPRVVQQVSAPSAPELMAVGEGAACGSPLPRLGLAPAGTPGETHAGHDPTKVSPYLAWSVLAGSAWCWQAQPGAGRLSPELPARLAGSGGPLDRPPTLPAISCLLLPACFTLPATACQAGTVDPLTGFHARRVEFDPEYDNEAECVIADLEFGEGDSAEDRASKLRMLEIYNWCGWAVCMCVCVGGG